MLFYDQMIVSLLFYASLSVRLHIRVSVDFNLAYFIALYQIHCSYLECIFLEVSISDGINIDLETLAL